jgi:DNA-binding NarL/FixJ family response regulator
MEAVSLNTRADETREEPLLRVLVADDHDLVRESIGAILRSDGFSDVCLAATLPEAIEQVEVSGKFDLIFLDYDMPGMNGMDGLSKMLAVAGDCPVALLTGVNSPEMAQQALDIGAAGFVPKTLSTKSMISAAKFMTAGEKYLPLSFMQSKAEKTDSLLSKRETEVLKGICEGKSNKEIAIAIDLQEVTIKLHVKTLTRKLGARNRTHAAMIARDRALF